MKVTIVFKSFAALKDHLWYQKFAMDDYTRLSQIANEFRVFRWNLPEKTIRRLEESFADISKCYQNHPEAHDKFGISEADLRDLHEALREMRAAYEWLEKVTTLLARLGLGGLPMEELRKPGEWLVKIPPETEPCFRPKQLEVCQTVYH